jgi:hypothetical protein
VAYGRVKTTYTVEFFSRNIQDNVIFHMNLILDIAVRTSDLTLNPYLCVETFIYNYGVPQRVQLMRH